MTEMTVAEPVAQLDVAPTSETVRTSPISEVSAPVASSFRIRTAELARGAMNTAQQRRALLTALLGVALISATIGVLAGRWLAVRNEAPAATR